MNTKSSQDDFELKTVDYIASAARAGLGAVPFAGSLLVEIADYIIPNQRMDRIIDFAKRFEERLANLEEKFIRAQLEDESFTDLLEEVIKQVARSISEERRNYIASLIMISLTNEEVSYIESKHILNLLGELNDIEVIWLRFFLDPTIKGDEEFRETHKDLLKRVMATLKSSPDEIDQEAIQDIYIDHLERLGLIKSEFNLDRDTNIPEYDSTGNLVVRRRSLTRLGDLMLRMIGLSSEEENR